MLNPKLALFYLAFMPEFFEPGDPAAGDVEPLTTQEVHISFE